MRAHYRRCRLSTKSLRGSPRGPAPWRPQQQPESFCSRFPPFFWPPETDHHERNGPRGSTYRYASNPVIGATASPPGNRSAASALVGAQGITRQALAPVSAPQWLRQYLRPSVTLQSVVYMPVRGKRSCAVTRQLMAQAGGLRRCSGTPAMEGLSGRSAKTRRKRHADPRNVGGSTALSLLTRMKESDYS